MAAYLKGNKMPMMIRPAGKAKKIAYKILGVPANMNQKTSKVRKKIDSMIIQQDTSRGK